MSGSASQHRAVYVLCQVVDALPAWAQATYQLMATSSDSIASAPPVVTCPTAAVALWGFSWQRATSPAVAAGSPALGCVSPNTYTCQVGSSTCGGFPGDPDAACVGVDPVPVQQTSNVYVVCAPSDVVAELSAATAPSFMSSTHATGNCGAAGTSSQQRRVAFGVGLSKHMGSTLNFVTACKAGTSTCSHAVADAAFTDGYLVALTCVPATVLRPTVSTALSGLLPGSTVYASVGGGGCDAANLGGCIYTCQSLCRCPLALLAAKSAKPPPSRLQRCLLRHRRRHLQT